MFNRYAMVLNTIGRFFAAEACCTEIPGLTYIHICMQSIFSVHRMTVPYPERIAPHVHPQWTKTSLGSWAFPGSVAYWGGVNCSPGRQSLSCAIGMVCGLRRPVDLLPLQSLLPQNGNEGACLVCSAVVEIFWHARKSAERPSKTAKAELSGFHAECPRVPRHPGDRADRTGCGHLQGRIAGCLSISPDVVCRPLSKLSRQDQCAKRNWFEGFHHHAGS